MSEEAAGHYDAQSARAMAHGGRARPVAFVTGASRGVGRACAIELARAGFDLALSARTRQEGERREHSSTIAQSDTSPLPGSLETTAREVEAAGGRALVVPADLLDRDSLEQAAERVVDAWGGVDLLINNARYVGAGHMDRLLDAPLDVIEHHLQANVLGPLALTRKLLPGMVGQGGGTIVFVTSASGYTDPPAAAGDGGWGMGYGISKAGAHRIPGFLKAEHEQDGIRAFLVHPGLTATERIQQDMLAFGFEGGAPVEVIARVMAWLATSREADGLTGQNIEAQFLCHERGLLPGWPGPTPNAHALRYDRSGATLEALEEALTRTHSHAK
jgi:NAD(P)-dependent dehydrogenase (short-subunit alcohol dehydrogenase family)